MKRCFILLLLFLSFTSVNILAQAVNTQLSGELIIFHAGSLSVPFKEVIAEFNKIYPNVKVLPESAGSVASARKITDLGRPCDIMASADYAVIDKMLIPNYADWNIRFVTNELSIVYTDKSRYSASINSKNWIDLLLRNDVAFGRADPNSDPCGYRTVMALQLAEKYYRKSGLAAQFITKDVNMIRPKEVDLVALLESGALDYIFLYRSVAVQHQLKYLQLPDEINLKNPALAKLYATSRVEINGKEPGSKELMTGEPMIYGITILKNAPNRAAALAFIKFLLNKQQGIKILERNGQPSVIPMPCQGYERLPKELKSFALPATKVQN